VVIGVFAVTSLVSLVKGVQNFVTDQFEELGSNLIFVSPGRAAINTDPAVAFTDNKLNQDHVSNIQKLNSDIIVGATPSAYIGKNVSYKTKTYFGMIAGVNYQSEELMDMTVEHGRFFTYGEEKSAEKVAVVGPDVVKELFGNRSPINEKLKIDGKSFKVIGVFEEKGPDYDEQIVLPYTTIKKALDVEKMSYIVVELKNNVEIEKGAKQIELTMLRDLKIDDFTVMTQADLLESVQQILSVISIGLVAIAAISLFVGGIGIMNIMLVSVTERTREVGLRKALGATRFNIGTQFLIEAVVMSVIGGLIGLLLGWGASTAAQQFIRAEIPVWAAFMSVGFSLFVGVVFGTYPALQASKKDAIEALRYE
ncbi:ABC transporter permease, partial [bacterium]|nr:ABC transporter permease [bacterium]